MHRYVRRRRKSKQRALPSRVPMPVEVRSIAAGGSQSLALGWDGSVWAWGLNSHGELGDGTAISRSNAVQVLNVSNIVMVSGGDYNSAALRADGTVWKWGLNDVGELITGPRPLSCSF